MPTRIFPIGDIIASILKQGMNAAIIIQRAHEAGAEVPADFSLHHEGAGV